MKLKQLESYLQEIEPFEEPKIKLEQYQTSPHLAATILHSNQDDFAGKMVIDLGCGSGIFTAGVTYLEANYVLGIDIDPDALEVCQRNLTNAFLDDDGNDDAGGKYSSGNYDLMLGDVTDLSSFDRLQKSVDTVIMNPPFGTRVEGMDMTFLDRALDLATTTVFSLHKTSTRDHIQRRVAKMQGNITMTVVAELRFDLPATYKFHKQRSVDIEVDLIRFSIE